MRWIRGTRIICPLVTHIISDVAPKTWRKIVRETFWIEGAIWILIFGYRALCIARGQAEPLPQFDENLFVETADFDSRPVAELADELLLLRHANLSMMQPLPEAAWRRTCTVSGVPTSVSTVAWVMAGHFRHHVVVLEDRYGISIR